LDTIAGYVRPPLPLPIMAAGVILAISGRIPARLAAAWGHLVRWANSVLVVDQLDRPDIPKLRADTVFLDKKAYMIPHIYGNLIPPSSRIAFLEIIEAHDSPKKSQ
jgi:hypothetical protein